MPNVLKGKRKKDCVHVFFEGKKEFEFAETPLEMNTLSESRIPGIPGH